MLPERMRLREEVFPDYTLLGINKEEKLIKSFEGYKKGEKLTISHGMITKLAQSLTKNVPSNITKELNSLVEVDRQILSVTIKFKNESKSKLKMKMDDLTKIFDFVSKERLEARDEAGKNIVGNIKIKRISLCDGRVVIECNDEYTQKWLKHVKFGSMEGHKYMIYKEWENMVYCSIKVLTKPKDYSSEEFKKQMISGNPEIKIKVIIFHNIKNEGNGESVIYFSVDKSSYENMRAKNFEIFFDCTMTQVERIE